jgi:hypothetical protein
MVSVIRRDSCSKKNRRQSIRCRMRGCFCRYCSPAHRQKLRDLLQTPGGVKDVGLKPDADGDEAVRISVGLLLSSCRTRHLPQDQNGCPDNIIGGRSALLLWLPLRPATTLTAAQEPLFLISAGSGAAVLLILLSSPWIGRSYSPCDVGIDGLIYDCQATRLRRGVCHHSCSPHTCWFSLYSM